MRILVTLPQGPIRDSFFPAFVCTALASLGDVSYNNTDTAWNADALRRRLPGVDVCFTGWGCVPMDKHILKKADRLRIVAHTGGSVATLATDALYAHVDWVLSGNELYAESVAEAVIAYAMAMLRDLRGFNRQLETQGWSMPGSENEGLLDQTVGLVGFGMAARHLVRLLAPFRTPIKVYADHVTEAEAAMLGIRKATLPEIFETCKIISLHLAQTPETLGIINRSLLERIPLGSLLINTARGGIVDEESMADLLIQGRFRAVLDVYAQEPLPMDSRLRGLPNALLIPHMAGPTMDRRPHVTLALLEDLKRIAAGDRPRLAISKEAAARMTR